MRDQLSVEDRLRPNASPARPAHGSGGNRQDWALRLQATAGNAATSQALAPRGVQRHPEGAALPDQGELAGEVAETVARADPAPQPVEGDPGPPAAPPAGGEQLGGGEAELPAATGTAAEQRAATAAGTTYRGELAAAGSGRAMSLAGAQAILQGSFGDMKTIVAGSIQVLADRAACWAKYDEVCMAANLTNPDTGVAWASGDAQRRTPGLDGFAWGGVVYVNGQTTLVTATAHEMLHNNTAAGFRAAVGEAINEGCTEYLAKLALRAAGVPTAAGTTAYPTQVAIVEALVAFVGESVMKRAYFGGVEPLIRAYERARGVMGSWAAFMAAADSLDMGRVTPLLEPHPAVAPAQPDIGGVLV